MAAVAPAPVRHALTTKQVAWLAELLGDCQKSPRLSTWEGSFVSDVRQRFAESGMTLALSDRQMETLRKIEERIHAAG
jgi:hypothetical protein